MPHQQAAIPSGGRAVAVAVADRGGGGGGASLFRNFVHGSHAGRPPSSLSPSLPSRMAWQANVRAAAGCDDVGSGGKGREEGDVIGETVNHHWLVVHGP